MLDASNLLTVLPESEKSAFYDVPEFNNKQRLEFLTLTGEELEVAFQRATQPKQVYCMLQIGYFKAVRMFFRLDWQQIAQEDINFILLKYFWNQKLIEETISKHEYYTICSLITKHFSYQGWDSAFYAQLQEQAYVIVQRDVNSTVIALELLTYLQEHRIIRPGYTTLQRLVSEVINQNNNKLIKIIKDSLTSADVLLLQNILTEDDGLSKLAAIKQDAKDFKYRIIVAERDKLATLEPIYQIIKKLLPTLKLSKQNMHHYAELVNYHSIYDLREKIKTEQTYLYILCYCWKRYQQISDNHVNAFSFFFKQYENSIIEMTKFNFSQHVMNQREEFMTLKRLAQLYVDDELSDIISFGEVREKAFAILSKEELLNKVSKISKKPLQEFDFFWTSVDKMKRNIRVNLRHLVTALDFSSVKNDSNLLEAISWIKTDFIKANAKLLLDDCPEKNLPAKLIPYITTTSDDGISLVNATRYEFWTYRQLYKQLKTGRVFLEDSLQYRSLNTELVTLTDDLIRKLNLDSLNVPIKQQLDILFTELDRLWKLFNQSMTKGKLSHLRYDNKADTLHWQKLKFAKEELRQQQFYAQPPTSDINAILRFVNKRCGFLTAFTHIQPRYAKSALKENHLLGTIIAQAMNNGNLNMSEISDIPYSALQDTLQSRVRLATLKVANDLISNDIAKMSIFPYYSFDLDLLYGGVDGQKFQAATPTIKSRYSKKHFGKGKGVVAYTMLANHIPLQVELIGANEHESYFVFDIWYNNTSNITPDIITGDMHCINKANFATMHWFNGKLYPRFTDIQAQRKHLYATGTMTEYDKYLIKPSGQIDRQIIENQWGNLQRIIATLALKETTQSTLIRKLCTYKQEHNVRKALFEFDKLIRSIHTLKYLLDPSIQKNTHRSQNRVESYHQLRGAIAQAYGKKQLIGKTDIALEISNQCGRLIANAIIHYNSAILSKLRDKYESENNQKALNSLKKISPVAWQHINFIGRLNFSEECHIDLDEMVSQLKVAA